MLDTLHWFHGSSEPALLILDWITADFGGAAVAEESSLIEGVSTERMPLIGRPAPAAFNSRSPCRLGGVVCDHISASTHLVGCSSPTNIMSC